MVLLLQSATPTMNAVPIYKGDMHVLDPIGSVLPLLSMPGWFF